MTYSEDELLPISALAHLKFCERRCALIHIEQVWTENRLTAEGRILHEKVHDGGTETRGDLHIARGLHIQSLELGLTGITDLVEFHRLPDEDVEMGNSVAVLRERGCTKVDNTAALSGTRPRGGQLQDTEAAPMTDVVVALHEREHAKTNCDQSVFIPGLRGRWRPFPVEYKRGIIRHEVSFAVQLCAQAMCLEQMLSCCISSGALFYGLSRRRVDVEFTDELRNQTRQSACKLHALIRAGKTPPAIADKKCKRCSLFDQCQPGTVGSGKSAKAYLDQVFL
jgi:CRISPR-associated exonuclease Cas4